MIRSVSYSNICSIILLFVLTFFLFNLRYDIPLYGDDVLLLTDDLDAYVDEHQEPVEITLDIDFSMNNTISRLKWEFFSWSGRVTKNLVEPLVRLIFSLDDGINWVLFSLYVTGMLMFLFMLVIMNVFGSVKAGLDSPMKILFLGLLIFIVPRWSYAYMTRIIMFTFADIYVLSLILYLGFCYLIQRELRQNRKITLKRMVAINFVGLLAGLSHEANGIIFGIIFLMQLGKSFKKNDRKIPFRYLFMYTGFVIGYCICFFAPGNFNRMGQSHDAVLLETTFFKRLINSVYIHVYIAYSVWIVPFVVIPLMVAGVIVLMKKKVLSSRVIIAAMLNNLEWFMGVIVSAIIWGMVSYVAVYGMLATNIMLVIGIVRVISEVQENVMTQLLVSKKTMMRMKGFFAGGSLLIVLILIGMNYSEFSAVHRIADQWREAIYLARKEGKEEVTVPAYPDNLNYKFFDIESFNQSQYDSEWYCVVYGTHILIK